MKTLHFDAAAVAPGAPGASAVRLARDAHGVFHVRAAGEPALSYGLGYCHGHDRGLQMLLLRIIGRGRICEQLRDDEEGLAVDRFFRRLNLYGGAEEEAERFSPRARGAVQSYCAGVERAFAERVPWELKLLGYRHEAWTPADVVLTMRVSGYVSLAQSQGEIERLLVEMVQAGVAREHLEELFPGLLEDLDVDLLQRVHLGERLVPPSIRWKLTDGAVGRDCAPGAGDGLAASVRPPVAVASNNWVIAGSKTKSGKPLLSNDPHLEGNRLPSVWYETAMESPQGSWVGASMPGLPAIAIGRSEHLAWGATYTFMDSVDSWIEDCREGRRRRIDPETGEELWVEFRHRRELIRRKKHADETLDFYESQHGTLDGDPFEDGLYLSTRWASAAGTGAASVEAMLDMPRAKTVAEGMDLVGRIETAWNWVLADDSGEIGYQMSGLMPRRREGAKGLVPLRGWKSRNDWDGFVSHQELPRERNPSRGFIVTANEDRNHLGTVDPITMPMGAYRAERIADLLSERDDWDVKATLALQRDVYSLQAERFMAVLRPLLPDSPAGRLLAAWDCRYDEESAGAVLFERVYLGLVSEVLTAVCGRDVAQHLLEETGALIDFYANFDRILLDPSSVWYGEEGRGAMMRRVAFAALSETESAAPPAEPASAPAPGQPRWGSERRVLMGHLLFGGKLPRWMGFDYGPIEVRGGRATVQQGQIYRSGGRDTTFMPSYRIIADFGEPVVHTALAGGPSDRRFSKWYKTGIADWLAGRVKRVDRDKHLF